VDDDKIELAKKYPLLTERELNALRVYASFGKQPDIAPSTIASFYSLFLNGKTCQEIVVANSGFSLAQIVKLRVDHEWDQKRFEYINQLLVKTNDKMIQIKLESMNFLGDAIAVTHKLLGEKLVRFLQTGNVAELEGVPVGTLGQYKLFQELLAGLATPQKPGMSSPNLPGPAVHVSVGANSSVKIESGSGKPDRAKVLNNLGNKLLDQEEENKN
jgi:hypothetical protein